MPHRDHHSPPQRLAQPESEQEWQALVHTRLPADLEEQAWTLKAFQRRRSLSCTSALLRGLLYYVLSHTSLREVAGWSRLMR
jgi:hypothetical protein